MRTAGEQHQYGRGGCLIDQQMQPFEGSRVRPVHVFQDKEDRLTFGQFEEDGDNSFEGLLPLKLR